MAADNQYVSRSVESGQVSKGLLWTGWILTVLPLLFMVSGAIAGLLKPELMMQGLSELGYSLTLGRWITILELIYIVIYLVPRTSVLGVILLTSYLGGATASHLRVGQSPVIAIVVCIMLWAGLYCREPRLRALIPFRK